MKVARADEDDFKRVRDFFNPVSQLFDNRYGDCEEDWRGWPDDDKDKKLLLQIEKEIKDEDGDSIWGVDNRLILYEFIKRKFQAAEYAGGMGRVITNAEVLVEDVCDSNLDYLEFKPEIKKAIDEYEEKHKSEEDNTSNQKD